MAPSNVRSNSGANISPSVPSKASSKAPSKAQLPASLDWVVKYTRWMDTAFKVPGTKWTFGLDGIIGLIPFLGELVTLTISSAMLYTMAKQGVAPKVVLMMLGNILLDLSVGSIPFIGDIFDMSFKANLRNLNLLRAHYEEGKYSGSVWPILLLAGAGITGLLLLAFYGAFSLGKWLLGLV